MRGALCLLLLLGGVAEAHELTPNLLSIEEQPNDTYDIVWRVPLDEAPRGLITPVLPAAAQPLGPPSWVQSGLARSQRWKVRLPGGLGGQPIGLDGPSAARTDALLRIAFADGAVLSARLIPGGAPYVVPARPPSRILGVLATYLRLGAEHILLGVDHLLFVLGLLLLCRSLRALLTTITAFTVAHSLTLALAALGLLRIPAPPVEATIALSIVFVARELLGGGSRLPPWSIALTFGLLHGLGFAGALAEIGLPPREIPLALFAFNVGVEIGQLLFVAAVVLVTRPLRNRQWLRPLTAYAIGVSAFALLLTRLSAF